MNRIELIRALRQEAGISGSGPASSAGAAGQTKELVDRIDNSWLDIQRLTLWSWMWEQAQVTINEGESLSAATGVPARRYIVDSMRDAAGWLEYCPWDDFRATFPTVGAGQSRVWSVRPDTKIAVSAVAPAGGRTLTVERYRVPVAFTDDADVPALPQEFHMLIVWLALRRMAAFDEAGSRYQTAEREYTKMLRQLMAEQTTQIELGGPLC